MDSDGLVEITLLENCHPVKGYDFFFQAEDGIRDGTVTGVQTCALPIYAAASWATMSAVETFAFGPASHCGAAAARPCFAAHVWFATIATASSSRTTWLTPGTAFAFASSTETSLPPKVGEAATTANFIPGSRVSMPNFALPLTLPVVSRRRCGVPINLKSAGSLSATFSGTGSFAAASTSAP